LSKKGLSKKERQKLLKDVLIDDPFLNDEELAEKFDVSIQTVRLDRMELKLPELRERMRVVAQRYYSKVRSIDVKEIVGELVDLELDKRAISILETTPNMTFGRSKVIGNNVTVGHGAIVHGCVIKDYAFIGMGSIILDGAIINEGVLIGAGALVPEHCKIPPYSLVMGFPARVVKPLPQKYVDMVKNRGVDYAKLAEDYMKFPY
jgi:hypothetical protein